MPILEKGFHISKIVFASGNAKDEPTQINLNIPVKRKVLFIQVEISDEANK